MTSPFDSPWRVERTVMRIELAPPTERVDATLHLRRADTAPIGAAIVLDGCGLELRSVAMDGRPVEATERESARSIAPAARSAWWATAWAWTRG